MKKLIIFLFSIVSFAALGQAGSLQQSGIFLRVNDTTTYQTAAAAKHSAGYYDIYFNNQATTPHFDIWNGSSYIHVFDFNTGGGGGLTPPIDATDIADGSVTDTEFQYLDGVTSDIQTQLDGKQDEFTSQSAALVYASPGSTSGVPAFISLTADHLATLTTSRTVTSGSASVQTDNLRKVYLNSAGSNNMQIDLLTAGTEITFINIGAGTWTLTQGSGITLPGGSVSVPSGSNAIVIYRVAATPDVYTGTTSSGTVTNVTGTSPINVATGTTTPVISINNAAADGSTKGAASFTANDFDASSGNIGIDYTNGQKASASVPGFVSTTTQEFAGVKTMTSPIFKTDLNYSDGTTTKNYSFSSKTTPTTFPVVVLEPNATGNTNNRIAFDLMPSGSTEPTTNYDGIGTITWMDICDKSKTNIVAGQAHSLRLGVGATETAIRSVSFNGASALPMTFALDNTPYFQINTTGRIQAPFYTALDDQLSGALSNTKYVFVGGGTGIMFQVPADKLKVTDPTTAADANLVTALGQFWNRTGTTTITGATTIAGGSVRSPFNFTGSWTANANNQKFVDFSPTLTGSSTAADALNIAHIGGTLTSGANTQTLRGLYIDNTFVNGGAHTGLTNYYLQVFGTNNLFSVSQSQAIFGNTSNTNTLTFATGGSDNSITASGGNDLLFTHGTAFNFQAGSGIVLGVGAYSGTLHTNLKPFSSGATTSTATQRSSTNLNLNITEWNGSASVANFWTHRATMSTAVNQESYYDLYYGSSASLPTLANMWFRLKNNGDLLLGAGTATTATPTARVEVLGGGTTTGKTMLLEASDGTDKFTFVDNGDLQVDKTITSGGTTGDRTINKLAGTVNIAASGTTVTVTNSLVTTSSLIFCEVRTNDTTATIKNVVPGSGSFVINLGAAATAEVSIGFFIVN